MSEGDAKPPTADPPPQPVLERSRHYDNPTRYQEVLDTAVLELSLLSGSIAANGLDQIATGAPGRRG